MKLAFQMPVMSLRISHRLAITDEAGE
uniref:Uncharacterized protein n=1 Tax=Arundo donax TaxID=35708 RepID=A0A0A9AXE9_ARUDO